MIELLTFFSFNLVLRKSTIIKELGCRFINTETRVQRIIQHLVSLFFRDQALPDINNVEKVSISLDKGC